MTLSSEDDLPDLRLDAAVRCSAQGIATLEEDPGEREQQRGEAGAAAFCTICGVNVAATLRGTSISAGPISVSTFLDRTPLRELPGLRPIG